MASQPTTTSSYYKYANLPDIDTSAPDVYETPNHPRSSSKDGGSSRKVSRSRTRRGSNDQDLDSDFNSNNDDDPEHGDNDDDDDDDDDDGTGPAKKRRGADGANEEIDKTSLKKLDALQKFRNATQLDTNKADFSDRIKSRKPNNKRIVETGPNRLRKRDDGFETATYEFGNRAEQRESPIEKLRRLKFEATLLEEEISRDQTNGSTATSSKEATTTSEQVPLTQMLSQLKTLQDQLNGIESSDLSKTDDTELGAIPSTGQDSDKWEAEMRTLFQQLYKNDTQTASKSADTKTEATTCNSAQEPGISVGRPVDVGSFDRRLAELEDTLGIKDALLDETKPIPKPILPILNRLEHQLQLLSQPRHLDAISRRIKVLVTELDRVQESRRKLLSNEIPSTTTAPTTTAGATTSADGSSSSVAAKPILTAEDLTNLQHLFSVSNRLDPLLPVIPTVLERLQSLSDLHTASSHFAESLNELERKQQNRETEERETKTLLQRLTKSLDENEDRMKANLESVEKRIGDITKRMEKLAK